MYDGKQHQPAGVHQAFLANLLLSAAHEKAVEALTCRNDKSMTRFCTADATQIMTA